MAFSEVTDDIEIQAPPAGEALSFTASNAITAGQVVKVDGDQTCTPVDTNGEEAIGVAVQSVSANEEVTVVGNGGRVRFTAAEGIAANDALTPATGTNNGEVGTASATGDSIIGYALDGTAGSQGDTFIGVVDRGGEVN